MKVCFFDGGKVHTFQHSDSEGPETGYPRLSVHHSLGDVLSHLSGETVSQRSLEKGERVAHRLLLTLHFYQDFYHLTALLGRRRKRLAHQLLPRFQSLKTLKWTLIPTVVEIDDIPYSVSIKLMDWSGLDSTADDLETLCLRFNVAFFDQPSVFFELWKARVQFMEGLCNSLQVKMPETIRNQSEVYSLGTLVSKLFTGWLETHIALTPTMVDILAIWHQNSTKFSANIFSYLYGIYPLIRSDFELTKSHLGVVLGGRVGPEPLRKATKGDTPFGSSTEPDMFLDMDIKAAYGTAMAQLPLAVGHPTLVYYPRGAQGTEQWPTLEKFLLEWEHELVDFCWSAVVDTFEDLSFAQNVLCSKLMLGEKGEPTIEQIACSSQRYSRDNANAHVGGQTCLLTHQVVNGV